MFNRKIPMFSVCIPTYNRRNLLRSAIQSVIEQDFLDFELVIVDDKSTDNTPDIFSEFDDPRIRFFVNDHNIGLVANWNRCFELATGEIIWILHDDDILAKDALSKAANIFNKYNIAMLYGNYQIFSEQSPPKLFHNKNKNNIISVWKPGKESIQGTIDGITCSTVSIRKEVFSSIGGFDLNYQYSPDEEYYPRIAKNYSIAYTADILALRRDHDNFMIKTWAKNDFFDQYSSIYDTIYQYAIDVGADSKILSKISIRPEKAILFTIVPILLQHGEYDLTKKYLEKYIQSNSPSKHLLFKHIWLIIIKYLPKPILQNSLILIAKSLRKIKMMKYNLNS